MASSSVFCQLFGYPASGPQPRFRLKLFRVGSFQAQQSMLDHQFRRDVAVC